MRIQKDYMKNKIICDSNFLIGLFDEKDKRHWLVSETMEELKERDFNAVYFDFVINEVVSVICKRFTEQKRIGDVRQVLLTIKDTINKEVILWSGVYLKELFDDILNEVIRTDGALNFNDASIVQLSMRFKIPYIASFDEDFDRVKGIKRIGHKKDLEILEER